MRARIWALAAAAALFVGAASAPAVTVYDANVSGPGWINGTGNPNGGFTVTTENGIEVAMRAKYRQNPLVIHSSNNNYSVVPGPQTALTSGGPAHAGRAAWNYEFSINLNPDGDGSYMTIDDIKARLTITNPALQTTSVNPITHWSDNTGYAPVGGKQSPYNPATSFLIQNSQNPNFGDFPLTLAYPGSYSMWTPGTYSFLLEVFNVNDLVMDTPLASTAIDVTVVPLPAAAWAGLAMMGVIGGNAARKRMRLAAAE